MAASDRFIMPYQTAWDAAGLVEAGALLYFYLTGTSTPLDTFSESTLVTPNTNPVVANAAGRFGAIFLGSSSYKVVLKDADGVEIWSADPVAKATTTAATTTVSGIVELATNAEGLTGTDTARVPPVSAVVQMIQQGFSYSAAGGTANALTGTPSVLPTALASGMEAYVRAVSDNTGATTLNWATLGVTAVKVRGAAGPVACAGGEIMATNLYRFVYSGSDSAWILDTDFAERMSPQTTDDTALTFTMAHAGRTIYHSAVNARTYTIPANSSVAYPIGTVIKIINGPAAGVITLAITTDTLQRLDGVAGTGSRTIAASSAVYIEKLSATVWGIGGVFS